MASTEFDGYRLPEEHQAIREAVRAVCDAKVAPYAAECDEMGEFPQGVLRGAPCIRLPRRRTSPSSTAEPVPTRWPP